MERDRGDGDAGGISAPVSVSVVVPNLDSPLVHHTLEALAAQGAPGPGVEVIVVGRDAPGLVPRGGPVIFDETAGRLNPAAARNRGVTAARGDKILFTDADCRPQPGWLDHLSAALERAPVAGGAVTFDLEANRWAVADNVASFHELLPDRPADDASDAPLGSLNLGLTRLAWAALGGFDEELTTSEDFDLVLRARAAGLATAFEPRAVVEHAAVRDDRESLEGHARWYGSHFHAFRRRHPEVFGTGVTWRHPWLLRLTAPLKARWFSHRVFWDHPTLKPARSAARRGVRLFRRAWYRSVLEHWPRGDGR